MSFREAGGRSPQALLVERCLAELAAQGADVRGDVRAMERIESAAEKAVRELESEPVTELNLPFLTATSAGPLHVRFEVRRRDLEAAGGPSGPIQPRGVKLG